MKKRSHIFKLAAFFLCSLYLLSSVGITVYACACTNNTQLSLVAKQTKHNCTKTQKQSCCAKKHELQNKHSYQLNKKTCCTTQAIALKAEHQPEQLRLTVLSTDFFQPILFTDTQEIALSTTSDNIVGSLSQYVTPPKIPLIYQHSCLRL